MGRLPTGNRQYQIKEMWSIHHEITRMLLLGMKNVDIAKVLGIDPVTVSYTANSHLVQRQLSIMRGARDAHTIDCASRIKELAPKAVEILDNLMDSQNEQTQLKAAIATLDRAGHAPVQRVQAETMHMHFSAEEMADIKKRARDVIDLSPSLLIEGALA